MDKMSRENRAKQFAPFDALKGLREALFLKEYEHEKIAKGELQEEAIIEISQKLNKITKHDLIEVTYYSSGYYHKITGHGVFLITDHSLHMEHKNIPIDDIWKIKIIRTNEQSDI